MNSQPLHEVLRRAGKAVFVNGIARASALAGAVLIVTLLLAVMIDAAFALDMGGLRVINLSLGVVLIVLLLYLVVAAFRLRYRPRWVARLVESRAGLDDNRLINALDLAESTDADTSPALRRHTVEQGNAVAVTLDPKAVTDRRGLAVALRWLCIALIVTIGAYLVSPRPFHAVLSRLMSPGADHPPYTPLRFDVQTAPEPVVYAKPAAINVSITGPNLPASATVVFEEGETQQRLPMVRRALAVGDDSDAPDHAEFSLRIDRAEKSRRFYIDTASGRSRWHDLEVKPVPLFERVTVAYNYPGYTGWKSAEHPLDQRGVRGLAGTTVTIAVRSNVPLGNGTIAINPSTEGEAEQAVHDVTLAPSIEDPYQAVGRFKLEHDGRFTLSLVGADGLAGLEPMDGRIAVIEDSEPSIYFEEPAPRVVVPEGWTVPVALVAEDDIGVARIVLHRGVNGWGPAPAELELDHVQPGRATATTEFDLAKLGAAPGDVITYFAVAFDNRPDPPNYAETEIYVIEVIAWDEYTEYVRTQYGLEEIEAELAEFNERLEQLRAEREALLAELEEVKQKAESDQPLTEADVKRLAELEEQLEDYAEAADRLAQDMQERAAQPQVYEFEAALNEMLQEFAEGLQQQSGAAQSVAEQAKQAAGQPAQGGAARQDLAAEIEKFKQTTDPFGDAQQQQREMTKQDMNKVKMANDMVAAAEQLRQVVKDQRELAERMAQFRNSNEMGTQDRLRAAKMAEEQADIRRRMNEATEQLKAQAEKAKDALPKMSSCAASLAERVEDMDVEQDQQDAERSATAGQGRDAHRAAETAAEKLESLLSDCNGAQGEASDDLDGCLNLPSESWAESMKQLAAGRLPGLGKQGGTGAGYSGSMASMVIAGPVKLGEGDSMADRRLKGKGKGQSRQVGAGVEDADPAEYLDPGSTTARTGGRAPISGVPARYLDEAEAYFKRIADDSMEKQ